jgi:hypothetical protein
LTDPMRMLGLVAIGLFVVFMLGSLLLRLPPRDPKKREAHGRWREAMARAKAAPTPEEKAAALREASVIALEGLARPGLAASLARRAERVRPSVEGARSLVRALEAGRRYAALERLIWRELETAEGERYDALFESLLGFYEGIANAPERARVLRKLKRPRSEREPSGESRRAG